MTQQRKLQIFLSSTYSDLIAQRLAAVEAILAAGHIPAAMEQFRPGDETAWEKICRWIDESDAYILILGGRYGSIEPESGKSYTQLEYEYALEHKKPFFSLVIHERHLEQRIQKDGLKVDERENPEQYKDFKSLVLQKHCEFWRDVKDIKSAIFQKLPEWSQREDLEGWIRGAQGVSANLVEELARLSQENAELRKQIDSEDFDGISFKEMRVILCQQKIELSLGEYLQRFFGLAGVPFHHGHLFDIFRQHCPFETELGNSEGEAFKLLVADGLVKITTFEHKIPARISNYTDSDIVRMNRYELTKTGQRLRNKLVLSGD